VIIVLDFLTSFIIALVLSALFVLVLQRSGIRSVYFWFFLVIFLSSWAGGVWMKPFGPSLLGIFWVPFLMAGVAAAAIFAAFAPRQPPKGRHETLDMLDDIEYERKFKNIAYISMSLFFQIIISALIVAVIIGYLF
jgi:hypothetical protein